jgi:hypothetical protein
MDRRADGDGRRAPVVHVSVLMPAYNAARTLHAAVTSTLRDLPRDGELLIVNDGSEDDTKAVLERFRDDKRLRVIHRTSNRGVATTLNELLDAATGHYIARMDADDICLPGRFAVQERYLSRPGVDAAFTCLINFGGYFSAFKPMLPCSVSPAETPYLLLLENVMPHSTLMTSRDLMLEIGGYRNTPAEDYDAWLRLAAAGAGMARSLRPGVAYRRHRTQVTSQASYLEDSLRHQLIGEAYATLGRLVLGPPPPGFDRWRMAHAVQSLQQRAQTGDLPPGVLASKLFHRALRRSLARHRGSATELPSP